MCACVLDSCRACGTDCRSLRVRLFLWPHFFACIKPALLLRRLGPLRASLPLTFSFEEWSIALWFAVWLHFNQFLWQVHSVMPDIFFVITIKLQRLRHILISDEAICTVVLWKTDSCWVKKFSLKPNDGVFWQGWCLSAAWQTTRRHHFAILWSRASHKEMKVTV